MRQPLNPMESKSESHFVEHNESKRRFEITLGEEMALAEYRVEGLSPDSWSALVGALEAVVPTACLPKGPWHKGLYN